MSKDSDNGLVRKHVWMDEDDYTWIEQQFGPLLKPSEVIRSIIKRYRKAFEAKLAQSAKPVTADIDLGE